MSEMHCSPNSRMTQKKDGVSEAWIITCDIDRMQQRRLAAQHENSTTTIVWAPPATILARLDPTDPRRSNPDWQRALQRWQGWRPQPTDRVLNTTGGPPPIENANTQETPVPPFLTAS